MNELAIGIPVAFLCGSIPFGYLIARSKGVDIRQHGSGNIGATNVLRVLGPGPGALCFALDVGKGLVPTLGVGLWAGVAGEREIPNTDAWLWLAVMVASVFGHMFSPWIGFKGGKGVATGLGALLGVYPMLTFAGLAALGVWIGVVAVWRYVGVASCLAALSLPIGAAVTAHLTGAGAFDGGLPFVVVTGLLALVVVVKHRGNLRRTLAGTEPKIGQRSASGGSEGAQGSPGSTSEN